MDEQKQLKKLFKKLLNDQNSVFYSADKINKTLLNKRRRSSYEKDKAFYRTFIEVAFHRNQNFCIKKLNQNVLKMKE